MATKSKYDIFISYRRVDSEGRTSGRDIARTIKLELEKRGYIVFFDYSEIKDNEFEDVILPAIHNSVVFIVVLSKDALLRCSNEKDWVRREIETAFNSGCKVIPVSPDRAFRGWPTELPDTLLALTKQQVSDISMGSLFEKSIDKLEEERIKDLIKKKASEKEDIDLQSINKLFGSINRWLRNTKATIVSSWGQRSIITNIIFCLYILPSFLLSFLLADLNRRSFDFTEVSIGFYAISLLYCIYQYFLNRRDGVYVVILSTIIVNIVGIVCYGSNAPHLYDSTILLLFYSILILCSLVIKKNHKSTWQHLQGGLFGLLKMRRHILFYLWCLVWIILVIYKTQITQSGY